MTAELTAHAPLDTKLPGGTKSIVNTCGRYCSRKTFALCAAVRLGHSAERAVYARRPPLLRTLRIGGGHFGLAIALVQIMILGVSLRTRRIIFLRSQYVTVIMRAF